MMAKLTRFELIFFCFVVLLAGFASAKADADDNCCETRIYYGEGLFNACNSIYFRDKKRHFVHRGQKGFEEIIGWLNNNLRPVFNRPPRVIYGNEIEPDCLVLYSSPKVPKDAITVEEKYP